MTESQPAQSYPPAVLLERSSVLNELRTLQTPQATGLVIDKPGTSSHEQGLVVSESGDQATLFIVDTSRFEPGGATDQYGLLGVSSVYADDLTNRHRQQRLFRDPILYKKLNVTNPEGCPTIGISFERNDKAWEVASLNRYHFHADSVHDNTENPEIIALSDTEHEIEVTLAYYIEELEASYGIGFIGDSYNKYWAHRPLRQWSDFKNIQLLARLCIDQDPRGIMTTTATEAVRSHVLGRSVIGNLATAAELLTDSPSTEIQILEIITSPQPHKYQLSSEAFRFFCTQILEEQVDIKRMIGLGRLLSKLVASDDLPPEDAFDDWQDYLITTLQSTDRRENTKALKNLNILNEEAKRRRALGLNHQDTQRFDAMTHGALGRLKSVRASRIRKS